MKAAIICLCALVAVTLARPEEHYTDKYDGINVQDILGNPRLLKAYVLCALDKGKCTPEGLELKSHITEAMENGCAKCTQPQRDGTETVISHLINEEPEYWDQLKAKFDPSNKFSVQYEKDLRKLKKQ